MVAVLMDQKTVVKSAFYLRTAYLAVLLLLNSNGCAPSSQPFEPVLIASGQLDPCKGVCTNPWVLVDTSTKKLTVYKRGEALVTFDYFAMGAAGAGEKQRRGDDLTPLGIYHVSSIRPSKKFHIFVELDYPAIEDGERAYTKQQISALTLKRIQKAHTQSNLPPQDTVLGGHIGLHGVGYGSLEIHKAINWTSGCIALENYQIEKLVKLLKPGVVVRIQ